MININTSGYLILSNLSLTFRFIFEIKYAFNSLISVNVNKMNIFNQNHRE